MANEHFTTEQDIFGYHFISYLGVEKKASKQASYIKCLRQQISQRGFTSTLYSFLLLLQGLSHALLPQENSLSAVITLKI